jgi:hypothetical protein
MVSRLGCLPPMLHSLAGRQMRIVSQVAIDNERFCRTHSRLAGGGHGH